jgi:diacylglycerol kinase family enzyme
MPDSTYIRLDIRRVLALVNPYSGRGRDGGAGEKVRRLLAGEGIEAVTVLVSSPDEVESAVNRYAPEVSAVVAMGGDGTINMAVAALKRSGHSLPLGLIPVGFGNCLARSFKLPLKPERAVRTIAGGKAKALDLVWIGDRPAVYLVSAGFDADVVRRAASARPRPVGMVEYLKAFWSALRKYSWPRILVEVDGRRLDGDFSQAILNRGRVYAKILKVYPGETYELYLFRGTLRRGLRYPLLVGPDLNVGRAADLILSVSRQVRFLPAADPPVPYQIDGDPADWLPITCDIVPRAFMLLVP